MYNFSTNKRFNNLIELNIALLFISTSGALGRYIDLPVLSIIAFRSLIAGIFIFLFCKWKKFNFTIKSQDKMSVVLGGIFMGLHWISYFYTLKLSNIAVGMFLLFTYPVITSFLEPIILKVKFQKTHLILGVLVLIGIYFLVPDFSLENNYGKAVVIGLFSAICYSLRNIIIKSKAHTYNGSVLMLYQLIIITICLFPFLFILNNTGFVQQLPASLILALLTTAIGHTYFLSSFKHFSITSISIISGLQPIYGIIIGIIFLKEYPEISAILGGGFILTSVVIESMRTYENK